MEVYFYWSHANIKFQQTRRFTVTIHPDVVWDSYCKIPSYLKLFITYLASEHLARYFHCHLPSWMNSLLRMRTRKRHGVCMLSGTADVLISKLFLYHQIHRVAWAINFWQRLGAGRKSSRLSNLQINSSTSSSSLFFVRPSTNAGSVVRAALKSKRDFCLYKIRE